jgi:CRP/FNR family transcriptional regulator, cyclic AMP receptor protein
MSPKARALADHPFMQGLDSGLVRDIGECATDVLFTAGQTIFKEGEDARYCCLLWDGKVSIEMFRLDQGSIVLQTVGAGDVLGWSWLLPPYRWRFDARATEPTRAVALDAAKLRALCDAHPDRGYALVLQVVQVMEQRLQATRQQLLEGQGGCRPGHLVVRQ